MDNVKIIEFSLHGDERGQLIAIEQLKDIPFEIKRVYYMFEVGEGVTRGCHAHKNLNQVLICLRGSCKVRLDDGHESKLVHLDNPSVGLFVDNNKWREMFDFTPGTVLMVLASEFYDESDYIRDYNEFIKYIKKDGEE